MKGAKEYCGVFPTAEQVGRLYILPSSHARGKTFRIYVLPDGEEVIENAGINPPLNTGAIEVYGVVSGHRGWSETYGWLHEGKWQEDFLDIYQERLNTRNQMVENKRLVADKKEVEEKDRLSMLLSSY